MAIVYPEGFMDYVKNYRAQHECSLQEARRSVMKTWLLQMLGNTYMDVPTKTILEVLIRETL